jgi:adenine-specific DNA methylase
MEKNKNMQDFFTSLQSDRDKHQIISCIADMPSNYVGSKRRMLLHIWDMLEENNIEFNSVLDAFSGSAMVSLLFKKMGKEVYSNDLLTSSAITAICLLENDNIPLSQEDIHFLCTNVPENYGSFVIDTYKDKFFTENECRFLDRFRKNIELLCGDKFYCGLDIINKATLASIPNSNFSVYGKDLKALRGVHDQSKSFWDEKWRDTTRKRRDVNNEIMFEKNMEEMYLKYKGAFSMLAIENHVNQNCFLGGRYYNGQTIAKMEHRIKHEKNAGKEITEIPLSLDKFKTVMSKGNGCVFNSDIIDLLKADVIKTDLIYLDPPYGGNSSDYAGLYRFLEEYLYGDKLENLEHIQKGGKRFSKKKGYQEHFEELLSLCGNFKTLMLSYNDSSYADLDTITSTIKNSGKKNIMVSKIPITYQYRKGKNEIDMDKFENYFDEGHQYTQRGTEYLIMAQ